MLIEFFGLPGVGKSTLSRRVAELLSARGVLTDEVTHDLDHRRRSRERIAIKLGRLVRHVAAHPFRALSVAMRIAATRQATARDLARSTFNWLFIASVAARARSASRMVLLDQGVAQAAWSIGFAAREPAWLDRVFADGRWAGHLPDLVVHVRADLSTVGERLAGRQRGASRMDDLWWDRQTLMRAASNAEAIVGRLGGLGVQVIEIGNDAGGDLAAGASLVADAIEAKLRARLEARAEATGVGGAADARVRSSATGLPRV